MNSPSPGRLRDEQPPFALCVAEYLLREERGRLRADDDLARLGCRLHLDRARRRRAR